MIKYEDSLYIREVKVFITRQGKGLVDERHFKTEEDFQYYKVDGLELRYVICGLYGVHMLPHRIYQRGLEDECSFASSYLNKTRRYQRELDATYFKFYDDAEEVLFNIKAYIEWLRTVHKMSLAKNKMKAILEKNDYLLRGSPDFPERTTYKIGSDVKMRSKLKGLALYSQNELDLIE